MDLYNFRFSENKYSGFIVSQLSFRLLTPLYTLNVVFRDLSSFYVKSKFQFLYSQDQYILVPVFSGQKYSSSSILRINIFQFLYSQDQYILVLVFSGSIYSSSCILRINIFQFLYSRINIFQFLYSRINILQFLYFKD